MPMKGQKVREYFVWSLLKQQVTSISSFSQHVFKRQFVEIDWGYSYYPPNSSHGFKKLLPWVIKNQDCVIQS